MNDFDLEPALRASLSQHADQLGAGGRAPDLAERIIAQASTDRPVRRFHRATAGGWRSWTFPLLAAGAVAAIAGGFLVAGAVRHQSAPPAIEPTSSSAPRPTPTSAVTSASPTAPISPSNAPTVNAGVPGPAGGPVPKGFHVLDLTFVSADAGWALGTADCLDGPGVCSALLRTVDGGRTWVGIPTPPVSDVIGNNGCPTCITHLRFANPRVGYAFGPQVLLMTTDGGTTWRKLVGGADALETLDNNVIRVSDPCGCSPGVTFTVETAPIGGTIWTKASVSGPLVGDGVTLTRTGHSAYFELEGNPAGGAQSAESDLYVSHDDGRTWTQRGEPCPQQIAGHAQEYDSGYLTSAPDGSIAVDCINRSATGLGFPEISTDGGVTFHGPGPGQFYVSGPIASPGAGILLLDTNPTAGEGLERSTDSGATWNNVVVTAYGMPRSDFVGFETPTTGRWVSNSDTTIWTTRDGGLTWTPYRFR